MFNIYDGPAYQDTNAYLDITETDCPNRGYNGGCIYGSGNAIGVIRTILSSFTVMKTGPPLVMLQ